MVVLGGGAVSYERGTPVCHKLSLSSSPLGTGLEESAGKEDPVELDSQHYAWLDKRETLSRLLEQRGVPLLDILPQKIPLITSGFGRLRPNCKIASRG